MEELVRRIKSIAPIVVSSEMVDLHSQLSQLSDYDMSLLFMSLEECGIQGMYDIFTDNFEFM